jgi:transcriptional regulator with XRE-family HTH domain
MEEKLTRVKPLKDLIEECGFTQKDFAGRVGVHYNSIKAYVAGRKMPTTDVTVKMCAVLNRPLRTVIEALGIDTTGIPDDRPE